MACTRFCCAVAAIVICAAAYAGQPGDAERQFLREAARGNLQNVFLIQMFGSFVAFPRTFVQLGVDENSHFLVGLHTDASIKTMGQVTLGLFAKTRDGNRKDVQRGTELPSQPTRTEQRGKLSVEYFDLTGNAQSGTVLIRDNVYYILLTGSAVDLADDLVATQLALAGPPDIFSGSWKNAARESDLHASRAAESSTNPNEWDDRGSCDARVFRALQVYSSGAKLQIMIRVRSGADMQSFQQTGFASDDLIVAIEGRPVTPEDDLHRWLREAAHGRSIVFSVRRGGSTMDVVLQPENARRALGECLK
jgi:hypothetical protein